MQGLIITFFGCSSIILIIIILSGFRVVQQNRIQIVQRFGKYSKTLDSGLNLIIPIVDLIVADISLAMQNQIFQIDTVSNDKVSIRLKANLIYSIDRSNVTKYFYELTNPLETLSSIVENYVRSYVSSQTHEQLLERREEISDYLIKHLDEKMKVWGIKISSFQVMDIVFPTEITDAMSKVVASQRLKEAAMNEAESAKIRVVKQAEAEKESRVLLGEGVAGERRAIIDGLKESIDDMKKISGIDTKEVMNLVVISQYFDTVRAVGESQNTKVLFMNPAPQGANDLVQSLTSAMEAVNDETKGKLDKIMKK